MNWLNNSTPVLMYHHVLPESGFIASSIGEFRAQMEFLKSSGYTTLTLDAFIEFKKNGLKPQKSLLITFDDGWRDNLIYAYPILKELGLKATIFIITDWIEEASKNRDGELTALNHKELTNEVKTGNMSGILTWRELDSMRDVFDIASHTCSHRDFYFSDKLDWERECADSQKIIKERLGFEARSLCWPRGEYDAESRAAALNYYDYLFTTKRGGNCYDAQIDINRIAVKKGAKWLEKTLKIYSSDLLAKIYGAFKS